MISLHCHTFYSDGELSPAELIFRCRKKGYKALALTDHADESNYEFIIQQHKKVVDSANKNHDIKVLRGIELTYVLPENIKKIVEDCRRLEVDIIVVHGETIVEPVPPGTNKAAIEAGVDILAHPGLIKEELVKLAAEKNVYLEITSRKGHSLTNGHVAKLALKNNCELVLNTDAHGPDDLIDYSQGKRVLLGAGINEPDIKKIFANSEKIAGL